MGIFSDILLTVDFDRTLTAPDSTIPPRNLDAIAWFISEGGAFIVNTGRSLPMCQVFMNQVHTNAPLLLYNGSAAYDPISGQFELCTPIDLDWHQAVQRLRTSLPDLTVELQGVEKHYIFEKDEMWERFCAHNHCPWGYGDNLNIPGPFLKLAVYGPFRGETVQSLFEASPEELARMDEAQALIDREFAGKLQAVRSGPRIIDIHAPGISKGILARQLQRTMGRRILVCAGDARNDLPMLKEADYAFIPADASISGFSQVCPCAEGAVADIIENYLEKISG